ncbi:universal stress protein [Herbaspirillum sp. RV1423]|uniref:universal stress protein n=1 Tax=Herbaspirillum sp. RV1423 TaxID=1443993 RepID=UPI0004B2BF14|nr:universal stress protein [Herbaspirillum sp. RV1423]
MTYKTILVHVDESTHAAARIRLASELAFTFDAHLIGAAMTGISRFIYPDGVVFIASVIDTLRERAQLDLKQFEETARQRGVTSVESRLTEDDAAGALVLQARYSDLVVISQTDPTEREPGDVYDLPEYVLLNSSRPVLTIPYAGKFDNVGSNIMVAWDGSMEATRAITNALPFLKKARNVNVVLFNPSALFDIHGQQPGADIALYLARHGVKVNVLQEPTDLDVGNALLSLAADTGADLLVMGGYGHTRFREVLLGGVTKTILNSMTIPVLFSH